MLLCICIPTLNRRNKLQITLNYHLNNINNKEVFFVVSDNCSEDDTKDLLKKTKKKYSNFDYQIQKRNIGPDANFDFVLNFGKSKGAKYLWLLGDDDIINTKRLNEILDYLKTRSPHLAIVNSKNQVNKKINHHLHDLNYLLENLAWHTTFMSTLIYSKEAINFKLSRKDIKSFEHMFRVFDYLTSVKKISVIWIQEITISSIRLDNHMPSWMINILDVFVKDWTHSISALPDHYSDKSKTKAIRKLWKNSKVVNYKVLIYLIFSKQLKYSDTRLHKEKLILCIGILKYYLVLTSFLVPSFFSVRFARFFYELKMRKSMKDTSRFFLKMKNEK